MNQTKCSSPYKTPALGSTERMSKRSSMLSTPPSRKGWGWDWRSVAPLLRITVGSYGPHRMTVPAQHFSLLFCSTSSSVMAEAKAIVFVVDDDVSVREGLGSLIRSAGLRVETFASAQEFLARSREDLPSCLVLDVRLPGLSGLDLQKRMAEANIEIPIVFITGHGDVPTSVRAMKAGAVEFLTKPFRDRDLLDAIHQAIKRDRIAREQRAQMAELYDRYESLTPREREVMELVVSGLLNKQVAAELGTSEITVKVHRASSHAKNAGGLSGGTGQDVREAENAPHQKIVGAMEDPKVTHLYQSILYESIIDFWSKILLT